MFSHMPSIQAYFLTSQYGDGSVDRLLHANGFRFEALSFGYLGRARIIWSLITVVHLPGLFWRFVVAYLRERCGTVVLLEYQTLLLVMLPILFLRQLFGARLLLYLGDVPANHRVNRILARIVTRFEPEIIVNSHAVKNGLQQIGLSAALIQVIYNGIDLTEFKPAPNRTIRDEYGWYDYMIVIGYVGQFLEQKGIEDFVLAADLILQQDSNCRFLMIGPSESHDPFRNKIFEYINSRQLQSKIVFTGQIDKGMEVAFNNIDIIVVPSRYEEPASNVILEAMACAIPVVATNVGGSPELLVDGVTGLLVPKQNPSETARAVLELAENIELRKMMGRASRERVCRLFDVRKNAGLVSAVLSH